MRFGCCIRNSNLWITTTLCFGQDITGDKLIIDPRFFEAWRDQVIIHFAEYVSTVKEFDKLNDEIMTKAVDRIMTEQTLTFADDVVEFLCPNIPKIGYRHTIGHLNLEAIEKKFVKNGSDGLALILKWKSIDNPESTVETVTELAEEDVLWPGTIKELQTFLAKSHRKVISSL